MSNELVGHRTRKPLFCSLVRRENIFTRIIGM